MGDKRERPEIVRSFNVPLGEERIALLREIAARRGLCHGTEAIRRLIDEEGIRLGLLPPISNNRAENAE